MELPVYDNQGKKTGKVSANDAVFGAPVNTDLIYQVATSQMSNSRQILAHTKDRSEVRGGGRKPWRQKGTGRARHGSTRSPLWVGGGVTFGPTKDRNFKKSINRVAARRALAGVLTNRHEEGRLIVADALHITDGKTKSAVSVLAQFTTNFEGYLSRKDKKSRVLVVVLGTPEDGVTRRAIENVPYADVMRASDLNAMAVMSYPFVLMTKDALAVVEKTLTSPK